MLMAQLLEDSNFILNQQQQQQSLMHQFQYNPTMSIDQIGVTWWWVCNQTKQPTSMVPNFDESNLDMSRVLMATKSPVSMLRALCTVP
jgi:hypothetical protein